MSISERNKYNTNVTFVYPNSWLSDGTVIMSRAYCTNGVSREFLASGFPTGPTLPTGWKRFCYFLKLNCGQVGLMSSRCSQCRMHRYRRGGDIKLYRLQYQSECVDNILWYLEVFDILLKDTSRCSLCCL